MPIQNDSPLESEGWVGSGTSYKQTGGEDYTPVIKSRIKDLDNIQRQYQDYLAMEATGDQGGYMSDAWFSGLSMQEKNQINE